MKTPAYRIALSYFLFSIIYFITATILASRPTYDGDSGLTNLFNHLSNIFFWANAYMYFCLALLLSTIVGMGVTYCKQKRHAFVVFRRLFFIFLIAILLLCVVSGVEI